MFAIDERQKRLVAEHAAGILGARLAELAEVMATAFDALWDAAPGDFDRVAGELAQNVATLVNERLPPAPFDPPSATRYRPVPGEHDRRREAQRKVDQLRRAMTRLEQLALWLPHWVGQQHAKPNAHAIRDALRTQLHREIQEILHPLQRQARAADAIG